VEFDRATHAHGLPDGATAQMAKRRVRPMLGFKSPISVGIVLSGTELMHMMRKRQARLVFNPNPSLAEQFEIGATA
jgi:putative transposase